MASERGFGAISFLIFLPFLITALVVVFSFWKIQNYILTPLQICRRSQLEIQSNSLRALQELTKLNPVVIQLRQELVLAYSALAAATASENPVAIRQALAEVHRIEAEQKLLKAKQSLILWQEQQETWSRQIRFQAQITKLHLDSDSFFQIDLNEIQFLPHSLSVRPDQISDKASVYEPEVDFSHKQSTQAFWRLKVQSRPSSWIHQHLPFRYAARGRCSGSLFEKAKQWEPGLWKENKVDKL